MEKQKTTPPGSLERRVRPLQIFSISEILSRFHGENNHERLKLVELESLARIYRLGASGNQKR